MDVLFDNLPIYDEWLEEESLTEAELSRLEEVEFNQGET